MSLYFLILGFVSSEMNLDFISDGWKSINHCMIEKVIKGRMLLFACLCLHLRDKDPLINIFRVDVNFSPGVRMLHWLNAPAWDTVL